ncbi:MAG: biotin/lipoyl-binding carrier protein [Deltaproteobacteria bacterium]|nr:biotin/lipoyl-binding carrier protein [Deltaproteobacteria bacterium]
MPNEIRAQITGTVWKVEKQAGDAVAEGDVVVILESMKMEIPIEAETAGTIVEVKVKEGDPVTEGALIATLQ